MVDTRLNLTAVFQPVEEGWVQARIEQLPGVITAAPSLAEARTALLDALREYLLSQGAPSGAEPITADAIRERIDVVICPA